MNGLLHRPSEVWLMDVRECVLEKSTVVGRRRSLARSSSSMKGWVHAGLNREVVKLTEGCCKGREGRVQTIRGVDFWMGSVK